MGLIPLTFLIGAVNLFVGYAFAVRFGYGPPTLLAPFQGRSSARNATQLDVAEDEFEAMLNDMIETSTEDMLDQDDDMEMDFEPLDEPYDEEAAALLGSDSPEAWDLNEKYVETSILRLNIAMMKSGARCTEIDTILRSIRGNSDRQTIEESCAKLKEDCESYLDELNEAAEKFSARIGELGDLAEVGEKIEFANMNQASQIETTISNLTHMDFATDPEASNTRLIEEIANLRIARHELRDEQEAAFLTIARYEDRMDKIEEKLYHDSLTGVRNRIGLEVALHEWWSQRRHASRSISAVLFDLDEFDLCNEKHGCLLGDRILYQIARLIAAAAGKSDMVARFGGQRFLLMAVDSGPRAAIKTAETLRQTFEKITFVSRGLRFGVTVSGGITEVSPEDETYLDVFKRLEESLAAAKQNGRNCLFGCQRNELDAEPEQINAPAFGIDAQEIEI